MPIYRAAGVRAFLTVDDIPLYEQPIGQDGTSHGVMQFIGAEKDMPFFMVEVQPHSHDTPISGFSSGSSDSPLSSLAATPVSGSPSSGSHETPHGLQRTDSVLPEAIRDTCSSATAFSLKVNIEIQPGLWDTIARIEQQHALKVKVEVLLHGQLVESAFLFENVDCTSVLHNCYLYRPCEKLVESRSNAKERWAALGKMIHTRAAERRTRKFDIPTASAEYLEALSGLHLPHRLVDKENIGVLDIVITAVKIVESQGVDLHQSSPSNPGRASSPRVLVSPPLSPLSLRGSVPLSITADIRLKKTTPSEKTTALARKYGLEGCLGLTIDGFLNRRGRFCTERSVYHRLVDIQKMRLANRSEAMQHLKSQLAAQRLKQSRFDASPSPSPTKRSRADDGPVTDTSTAVYSLLDGTEHLNSAKLCAGDSLSFAAEATQQTRTYPADDLREEQLITGMRFVVL